MTVEPVSVAIEPGPGCCGTIRLGGSTALAYRFGLGLAGAPPAAVLLTNQPGSVGSASGAEIWVPATWTASDDDTDEAAAVRRLTEREPSFVSAVLGGAEVTVLLPEPASSPAPGLPAAAAPPTAALPAAALPADSAPEAGEDPPFHPSWIKQQRHMRTFLEDAAARYRAQRPAEERSDERPQPKVSGHGNVVKAIRQQVDRGRALVEWRAETAAAVVVVLRTQDLGVLVGSGLDAQTWLALRAQHRRVLREVDIAVVRVAPLPLRHLPSYLRTALPRASAVVDAGHPGRYWPVCDPTPLEVLARQEAGAWMIEARTR